jgi:hypothetical protein
LRPGPPPPALLASETEREREREREREGEFKDSTQRMRRETTAAGRTMARYLRARIRKGSWEHYT